MENRNKNLIIHHIKMPRELALAFNKTISQYICIPSFNQFIMLPDDNETPLTYEHFIAIMHQLPIKYIYNEYLNKIVSYEDVSDMDFFVILNYETKEFDRPDPLTLEDFKFYIIDKEEIKEIKMPAKYKEHLFAVFGPIKEKKKRVRAMAFSSLFKYNNKIFLNKIFNMFRNNMNDDEFSNFIENKYNNALKYIQSKRPIPLFNSCADFWDKEMLLVSYQNYDDVDLKDQYNLIFKQIITFVKQKINSVDPILKKSIYEASGITCSTSETIIDKTFNIAPLMKQINNLPEILLH